jgi:NADPH:quinone reductase-like Zn-dependent oxidoreductase
MKAAVLNRLGDVPKYRDFAEPDLKEGETLVEVTAASIKQLDRAIVAGTHYSSPKALPVVCGTDGVGRTGDGARVYFQVERRPWGAMAERAPASLAAPVPDGLDDALAAAIVNPAIAAWLPLVWRGELQAGEGVLILGATGAAGHMAVRAARLLGAGRVVAAGRRQEVLAALGADATIDLRLPQGELREIFAEEAKRGIGVVVDYVWGPAVEALIDALIVHYLSTAPRAARDVRLVSVGAMAGPAIALPSAALRGSWLRILGSGTANYPPPETMKAFVSDILAHAARGEISLDVARRPLAEVSAAWSEAGDPDRRMVLTI